MRSRQPPRARTTPSPSPFQDRNPPRPGRINQPEPSNSEADCPIIGSKLPKGPDMQKAPVRRSDPKAARISLQCVIHVKEPPHHTEHPPERLTLVRATRRAPVNMVQPDPLGSLPRHPRPTVEARFTESLGGREELFYPSSAFRIVSLVCA